MNKNTVKYYIRKMQKNERLVREGTNRKGQWIIREGGQTMLTCDYIVERIDGDYALLQRIDMPEEELKTVARELLLPEIVEGSKLHYEWMQYSLI